MFLLLLACGLFFYFLLKQFVRLINLAFLLVSLQIVTGNLALVTFLRIYIIYFCVL